MRALGADETCLTACEARQISASAFSLGRKKFYWCCKEGKKGFRILSIPQILGIGEGERTSFLLGA